ncbi:phosphatidylinositol-specific phospholipase C1-like protein [Granulicella arctica]|uniref:phosphatidylinositol-specific phospholipase C1-like protein n=1 Tax=Granulicella arctica TaxID=940613 RepID=UPI0021DFBBAB|nr:phosphatidylinositol-specific phospholipase C1-like protein [Granulicella arctica]
MRLAVATLALLTAASAQAPDAVLRLNQIQVIGTHNSYHAGISPNESKVWQAKYADSFLGLDYQHPPLPVQFDAGVRQIELDIFADTKGGRYAHPAGPGMAAAMNLPADPDPDPNGLMLKPGLKVMHVQDVDYRSTCQPFIACLEQVRTWSHAHPDHIPIFILVETKEGTPKNAKLTVPEPFTAATFDALDAEIRSVFPATELITPDNVRGSHQTLNEAVLAHAWPTLDSARGKVVFLLDQRAVGPLYLAGHPSLRGRVLFTNAQPGQPDAAFIERNEGPAADITALVRQGYLIRARTDADTKQARTNDTTQRDAMMASGAQMLSTDYPANEPARWAGHFSVALPNSEVARCNPINAPQDCILKQQSAN